MTSSAGTSALPPPTGCLADRLHRAPDRRGQALRRQPQGRLLQSHRRLCHRPTDDGRSRSRRPPPGHCQAASQGTVVVHADRGGQFRATGFRRRAQGQQTSPAPMGRVASAGDNAAMESFYSLLQKNVLDQQRWATRYELAYRDRLLDRAHLQPPSPSARTRQAHACRIRTGLRRKISDAAADQRKPVSTEPTADPRTHCVECCRQVK